MDVTFRNFEASLRIFELLLPQAEFVSFDGEYSGLGDTPRGVTEDGFARYERMLAGVRDNCFMQLGLTLWLRTGTHEYKAAPFNFNVRPTSVPAVNHAPAFRMTVDTLQFHTSNRFDFNKWAYDAVPFVPDTLRAVLDLKAADMTAEQTLLSSTGARSSDRSAADAATALSDIDRWLRDRPADPELRLQRLGEAAAREVVRSIGDRPCAWEVAAGPPRDRAYTLLMYRLQPGEDRLLCVLQRRRARVNALWGASRVMDLLRQHRKPFVGHMCFYDLMFMYEAFKGPLPTDYSECKRQMAASFGPVYDTKLLAMNAPGLRTHQSNASLESLFKLLATDEAARVRVSLLPTFEGYVLPQQPPSQSLSPSDSQSDLSESQPSQAHSQQQQQQSQQNLRMHEAGFDSLATGVVFLRILERIVAAEHGDQLPDFFTVTDALLCPAAVGLCNQAALAMTVCRASLASYPDALAVTGRACVVVSGARRSDSSETMVRALGALGAGATVHYMSGGAIALWVAAGREDEARRTLLRAMRHLSAVAVPWPELAVAPAAAAAE